ncbi:Gfo/Idh/MocA family oxidoreductase [uncultured Ruegeria sp.]|uniref:Gfo/Idh/MocA family protein n=1 Tax=uncultured Ruegeria sp. TaxID=259304 RepID=UPI00262E051F|nr:Gfo/Idh/MocA family oxidoreductase [uncultured Ruegeria sp.]
MTADSVDTDQYALKSVQLKEIEAPGLPYRPPMPQHYMPRIGVIGTGGISASHLDAYRTAGWDVAAIWNRTRAKAEENAAVYCPSARIEDDWEALLADSEIDVVDITLHPEQRIPIIKAALQAGKHVLSQKPFVTDLDLGYDLVKLADDQGVKLAVNQNGRWAPHLSWMREAVTAGLIGDVLSAHISIHWDHSWTAGTPFDEIDHLILYDFGVHWFDFLASLVGDRAESVFATANSARGQTNKASLMSQALVRLDQGQASLIFDGGVPCGPRDTTYIAGTTGSLTSVGPDLSTQTVTLETAHGIARPALKGRWFNDGFRGAMGDLLCSIEDNREPTVSARNNLESLAIVFAAIASSEGNREIKIGSIRTLSN